MNREPDPEIIRQLLNPHQQAGEGTDIPGLLVKVHILQPNLIVETGMGTLSYMGLEVKEEIWSPIESLVESPPPSPQ